MDALDQLERLQKMNIGARNIYLIGIAGSIVIFFLLALWTGWGNASGMLALTAFFTLVALYNEALIHKCRKSLREHGR